MVTGANILHADLDAFFASVEQRDRPELRGKPVIVGPGVVMAASYEARAFGVRSAMGGGKARRLCPHAVVVSPRFDAYVEASRAVFDVLREAAPVVEPLSIDEAFLDVSGLERISGTPPEIARRLRAEVREKVGLAITIGVARTKHLAKVASAAAKPDGLLVVPPDGEREFLWPLPVERLWGVGPATTAKLHAKGLRTVREVAALEESTLVAILGPHAGRHIHALAHNRDPRRVKPRARRRSFGTQSASRKRTPEEIDATIVALVDRVTRRMRAKDSVGRTVTLRLRFDDFTRATRSLTLPRPTCSTTEILEAMRELYAAAKPLTDAKGCTLVGITVSNLEGDEGQQLALPLDRPDSWALDHALDEVRERFGVEAVTRAKLLKTGPRFQPWLQPDEGIEM